MLALFVHFHPRLLHDMHAVNANGGGIQCDECSSKKAALHCAVCEQHLCRGCSDRLHSKGSRTRHEVTTLSASSSSPHSPASPQRDDVDDLPVGASNRRAASSFDEMRLKAGSNVNDKRLQQQMVELEVDQQHGIEAKDNRYGLSQFVLFPAHPH